MIHTKTTLHQQILLLLTVAAAVGVGLCTPGTGGRANSTLKNTLEGSLLTTGFCASPGAPPIHHSLENGSCIRIRPYVALKELVQQMALGKKWQQRCLTSLKPPILNLLKFNDELLITNAAVGWEECSIMASRFLVSQISLQSWETRGELSNG